MVRRDVGAVIVGFDREINYHKIQYAQLCINENPGCEFIATNLDAVTHLTDAQEWAGNGAMAGAIKGCTGREPTLVGKPSPLMIDYIVDKYGCNRERICMVGDRLDTDILFGQNNGLRRRAQHPQWPRCRFFYCLTFPFSTFDASIFRR